MKKLPVFATYVLTDVHGGIRIADPHHINEDPDPFFHFNADPDCADHSDANLRPLSTDSTGIYFEPPRLYCERLGPSTAPF